MIRDRMNEWGDQIDQAFDIMIAHEQRHFQQALRLRSLIQSEKSVDNRK